MRYDDHVLSVEAEETNAPVDCGEHNHDHKDHHVPDEFDVHQSPSAIKKSLN